MNYLHSIEYRDSKEQLMGEYLTNFKLIESYYLNVYTEGAYEAQLTLSQILSDFLQAQKDEKPVEKVTGRNVKKYAIQMMQAEMDLEKSKWSIIHTIVACIWCVLFLVFIRCFFIEFKEASLTVKMNNFYFSFYDLLLLIIAFACGIIKGKISAFLFYYQKLIRIMTLIMTLPTSIFIIYYFDHYKASESALAIRVPAPIYVILAGATTIYCIVFCIIGYGKTKRKKDALAESDSMDEPAQTQCLSCGKEFDYDYPKCPYCGYKNVQQGSSPL